MTKEPQWLLDYRALHPVPMPKQPLYAAKHFSRWLRSPAKAKCHFSLWLCCIHPNAVTFPWNWNPLLCFHQSISSVTFLKRESRRLDSWHPFTIKLNWDQLSSESSAISHQQLGSFQESWPTSKLDLYFLGDPSRRKSVLSRVLKRHSSKAGSNSRSGKTYCKNIEETQLTPLPHPLHPILQ